MADQIRYAHGEIKAANGIDYVMDDEIIKHNGVKLKDAINAATAFVDYSKHNAELNETKIALNGYQHISKKAYGSRENATGLSVMINSSGAPEVMNVNTEGLSKYHDRDIVGAFISADGLQPLYTVPMNSVTYNSSGCTTTYSMPDLLPDMIIDTSDNNYVGVVKSYNKSTGVIVLEDGWWHKTNHVKGIPSGTGFWVQKTSKVWGINVNVGLPSGIKTNAAAIEAGLYNNGSTGQDRGVFDAVLLKGEGDYGARTRGNFFYGFLADGSGTGFCYRPSDSSNPAFVVNLPDGKYFVIGSNGSINRTIKSVSQKATAQIEMGESIVIESGNDATLTLPSSAPVGTIIEIFVAQSETVSVKAPTNETIWYEGGTNTTCKFNNVNHSLLRAIKGTTTHWMIFVQNMINLNEARFIKSDKDDIIQSCISLGTRVKNICPVNSATISTAGFIIDSSVNILSGEYIMSWNGTSTSGQTEVRFMNDNTVITSFTVNNQTSISEFVSVPSLCTRITMFTSSANTISNIMIRDSRTSDTFEPYKPSLQEQIDKLSVRLSALENK